MLPAPEPAPLPEPKPRLKQRGRILAARVWQNVARFWNNVRPGPEVRRGAPIGALCGAAILVIATGIVVDTGFGKAFDLALAVVVSAVATLLSAALLWLMMTVFRHLPRWPAGFCVAAGIVIAIFFPQPLGLMIGAIGVVIGGTLGGTLSTVWSARFQTAPSSKRAVTYTLLALSAIALAAAVLFMRRDGDLDGLVKPLAGPGLPQIRADNPGSPGHLAVKTLFYGSGTDKRRPEYRNVAIKTPTVDASVFRKDFKGFHAWMRRMYWGFDLDKVPLNARVWYPDGAGPFPLVLIVHGNHNMAEYSDPGYAYLGQLLASRGFILASVDENFLNASWWNDLGDEKSARGWLLLEHLKLWRKWNGENGNPFRGKVDLDRIALMGHSRGGEAAATAALFNRLPLYPDDANVKFDGYGFNIRSVVAIAPADGQYRPAGTRRELEDVSYFVLQGSHDADVSIFLGSKQFDRVKFTGAGPRFKSELYVYRANHGQFNTVWGRNDAGGPVAWLLNTRPLISGEEQRRIGAVYISGFLEATLRDRREYLPLFRDARAGRDWLPAVSCLNRYQDATWRTLANYAEDVDVTTGTMPGSRIAAEHFSTWKEGRIPFRDGDRERNGVFLAWNRATEKPVPVPAYSWTVPDPAATTASSVLAMSVSAVDESPAIPKGAKAREDKGKKKDDASKQPDPIDFHVEVTDAAGKTAVLPLSHFKALQVPLRARFTKLKVIDDKVYKKPAEAVLQTIEMPLRDFAAAAPGFDMAKLRMIRLRFDASEKGSIVIGEIGFLEDRQ